MIYAVRSLLPNLSKQKGIAMKRFICLLLALLTSLFLFGCGSSTDTTQSQGSQAADTATEKGSETEPETLLPAYLPADTYNGDSIRVGTVQERIGYVWREEMTGDILNDTVFDCTKQLEDKYDVVITPVIMPDSAVSEVKKTIATAITAGEDAYDLIMGHDCTMWNLSLNGYYRDMRSMPYQDFSNPWYPSFANEQYCIHDRQYVFTSYMSYLSLAWTRCILFNKAIAADYQIGNLYETVRNHAWTLDTMFSLSRDLYKDLNGDGKKDSNDLYGFVGYNKLYGFQGAYVNCYQENDGIISLHYNEEKLVNLITMVTENLNQNPGSYLLGNEPDITMFAQGNALFYYTPLDDLTGGLMRSSDADYGILPTPLYDETQQQYITPAFDAQLAVPVTVTEDRVDEVSILIEAAGALGYTNTRNVYFETVLSQKFTRDAESIEMLQIISDTTIVDLAYLNTSAGVNGLGRALMYCISNPSTGVASYLESLTKSEQAIIDTINDFYQ